ncbi:hypothetical protein OHU25_00405 [Streptomyces sp. NBC_00117]|uniref:hypothetical protein n=1 Tax=Streptomyces sp. NBC_00117 TaxID=2975657 RepID=UPI0032511B87
MKRSHQWTVLVTAAALLSGCSGHQDSAEDKSQTAAERPSTDPKSTPPSAPALPEGMLRLGSSFPFREVGQSDSWTVRVSALSSAKPSAKATSIPHGWRALTTKVTFTNTDSGIAELHGSLDVTARYGPEGRTAAAFTDTGIKGLTFPDIETHPIRVRPGGTYTTTVGYAVPASTAGQPLTITIEGDNPTYLEGAIPGPPASPVDTSHVQPVDTAKELKFGDWAEDSPQLRIGQPRATGTTAQGKRYAVDLSFFNDFDDTLLGNRPKANLKVYSGAELTEGDFEENLSNLPSLAWIAPQRMATVTVHFTIPGKQNEGPVSIAFSRRTDPGLTIIGTDPDGNHLLVNLPAARVLLLDGESDAVRDTARAIALEAATSTWSDRAEILTVGLGTELATRLPQGRLRAVPHLRAAPRRARTSQPPAAPSHAVSTSTTAQRSCTRTGCSSRTRQATAPASAPRTKPSAASTNASRSGWKAKPRKSSTPS